MDNVLFSASNYHKMARAIELAKKGLYTTAPNPRVGCVIVKNGEIVGEGWHQRPGEAHAEVNALLMAGSKARDATVYVTLEPCSYYGRTPPCAKTLINAGIRRVFIGMIDPNPQVSGKGISLLKKAGVEVYSGLMEAEARSINPGFIKRMKTGQPFIRCKMAASMDGRTAMASGESKWITGPAARADVQRLRGRSCAIITSVSSVINDDPSMTFRPDETTISEPILPNQQPLRVIVDSSLATPSNAQLFLHPGNVLLVCNKVSETDRQNFLMKVNTFQYQHQVNKSGETNVKVIELPSHDGKTDLVALFNHLGQLGCNEVLLECGATLAGAAIKTGCIDELWVYMAPVLMGSSARPLLNLPLTTMAENLSLTIKDLRAVGNDWRFVATIKPSGNQQ